MSSRARRAAGFLLEAVSRLFGFGVVVIFFIHIFREIRLHDAQQGWFASVNPLIYWETVLYTFTNPLTWAFIALSFVALVLSRVIDPTRE